MDLDLSCTLLVNYYMTFILDVLCFYYLIDTLDGKCYTYYENRMIKLGFEKLSEVLLTI